MGFYLIFLRKKDPKSVTKTFTPTKTTTATTTTVRTATGVAAVPGSIGRSEDHGEREKRDEERGEGGRRKEPALQFPIPREGLTVTNRETEMGEPFVEGMRNRGEEGKGKGKVGR